ncbi:hypothetical protein FOYG_16956 [Fusarium oxysporum NRRL 32931]|uniref:Zn(2)-C6 fungal-type domain-containing protein n=1 Tax=Fusarium oxysporum NRRL 32931 TaxID=660029 RepID=W9HI81_FUSOX|nr:hypothetical protein FOYG_16956 [Fusarium oxysporum NRRL 32931]
MDIHKKRRNACDPCRKRKIKCSGDQPICCHCGRLGLQCAYSQAKRNGRPRRRPSTTVTSPSRNGNTDRPFNAPPVPGTSSSGTVGLDNLITSHHETATQTFPSSRPLDGSPFSAPSTVAALNSAGTFLMPMNADGPGADNPALDWPHWFDVPCMLQHPPLAPQVESTEDALHPPLGLDLTHGCDCFQAISRYFTSVDGSSSGLGRFTSLREAITLSDRVLLCPVCFNLHRGEACISKNIVLLGALMSDVAMSYSRITYRLFEETFKPNHDKSRVGIVLGQQESPESLISMSLDAKSYWILVKSALMEDLARLSDLCAAFETRQLKAHDLGHEQCVAGSPCTSRQAGVPSAISDYVKTCPRNIDPRKTFSCFRTVNQVFSAVREAQSVVNTCDAV